MFMDIHLILFASIVLQLVAAFLALRLIWAAQRSFAWILIAIAICLMTLRRCMPFYQSICFGAPLDPTAELVALVISILLVVGMAGIAPLFHSIRTSQEALRLNESRLEALWQLSQMTGATLQQIADFALDEGVRLTKSRIGFVGFLTEEENLLSIVSWSKDVMEQCNVHGTPLKYPLAAAGLWGEAVRQRQPLVINDYAAPNPLKKGYPEGHAALRRFLSIPVFEGDRIVAVAGVANKAEPYDDADVRQLTLLMNGMWWLRKRKESEDALTHEVERMHLFQGKLIQTSSDGIVANDRQGRIIIFNEGAERILGYRQDEVVGRLQVEQLYPPGLAREIKKAIYDPDHGGVGRLVDYATVVLNREGQPVPVELSASLIFEDGMEVAIVGFFRDLRERQRLQEQLLQSERLAVLGQMAAHISHEIKNPLMLIGGFSRQVLRDLGDANPGNREKLRIITDEIKRLEEFLGEVGSYGKSSEPHIRPDDLNALIQDTSVLLKPSLEEHGIDLHLHLDPLLPPVPFDPALLRQVLLNLAKNSIEAMPQGGRLSLTTGTGSDGVFLKVTDTGVGIAPEVRPNIFKPFFSTKPRGTGLGLAISQKIIEAHKGEIAINSQPYQGTQVTVTLKP